MPLIKVKVLCPNGRRQAIPVDANTSILLIRETVCQKQNFDVESHELKFHKRFLDDSSTLRFENIPNNAELELVKSTRQQSSGVSSKVVILLQTEDGQRNSKEFLQTATLWDVVMEFGHENCKEGTQQSCRYLMKSVIGKEDLQKTTLRSLGILDGRVCLRYMEVPLERNEGQAHVISLDLSKVNGNIQQEKQLLGSSLKDDVMYSITEWDSKKEVQSVEKKEELAVVSVAQKELQKSEDEGSVPTEEVKMLEDVGSHDTKGLEEKSNTSSDLERITSCAAEEVRMESPQVPLENQETTEDVQMKDVSTELCTPGMLAVKEMDEESKVVNLDEDSSIADVKIEYLDDNGSVLLDPSLSSLAYLKWDPPDEFFEFTLADAYLLQKRLREQSVSESTLMLRGKNRSTSSKTYDRCVVRIHLPPPEELLLQSTFQPSHSIADVLSFVKEYLKHTDLSYYLFTTPPKEILDPSSTLAANNLVPSCLIHLGIHSSNLDSSESLVKDHIRSKAVSVEAYNRKMGCKESKKEVCEQESCPKQFSEDDYPGTASSTTRSRSNVNRTPPETQTGMPKWLKLRKN